MYGKLERDRTIQRKRTGVCVCVDENSEFVTEYIHTFTYSHTTCTAHKHILNFFWSEFFCKVIYYVLEIPPDHVHWITIARSLALPLIQSVYFISGKIMFWLNKLESKKRPACVSLFLPIAAIAAVAGAVVDSAFSISYVIIDIWPKWWLLLLMCCRFGCCRCCCCSWCFLMLSRGERKKIVFRSRWIVRTSQATSHFEYICACNFFSLLPVYTSRVEPTNIDT